MKPTNRLEYGSTNDVVKTAIFPTFTATDWKNTAHATRFFIAPFMSGSSKSNPDIITFAWKCSNPANRGQGAQPVISVASTADKLTNPRIRIQPKALTLAPINMGDDKPSPFRGFVKRFEDVNNKPMILFARATRKDPKVNNNIQVVPQVWSQKGTSDDLETLDSGKLLMPTYRNRPETDFYAVLVGDTR